MKRIVFLSGRLHSAAALLRVLGKYGHTSIQAIHVKTNDDLPDYLNFVEALTNYANVSLEVLPGIGVFEYFRLRQRFRQGLANSCYKATKLLPIFDYCNKNVDMYEDILYFGRGNLNDRNNRIIDVALHGYEIRYPMDKLPLLNHDQLVEYFTSLDLPLPKIFQSGLIGSNCMGGCIHYTVRDWVNLYNYNPALFDEWEKLENELLAINSSNYLCRAIINGKLKTVSLSVIKANVDSVKQHRVHQSLNSCIVDSHNKSSYGEDVELQLNRDLTLLRRYLANT